MTMSTLLLGDLVVAASNIRIWSSQDRVSHCTKHTFCLGSSKQGLDHLRSSSVTDTVHIKGDSRSQLRLDSLPFLLVYITESNIRPERMSGYRHNHKGWGIIPSLHKCPDVCFSQAVGS